MVTHSRVQADPCQRAHLHPHTQPPGLHTVADIACSVCSTNLGWTYISASEPSQKYKEGARDTESSCQ